MTYISWFSDFTLYLQHSEMDLYHTWKSGPLDNTNDFILFIGHYVFHVSVILPSTLLYINY